jgi:hypothetical protein
MPEKKKKTKKDIKVRHRDMKPRKDAKGGLMRFSRSSSTKQPTGLQFQ